MKTILFLAVFIFSTAVSVADTWSAISCGGEFSVALKSDNTLWGWGFNANGQLGMTEQIILKPTQIGNGTNWKSVSAGSFHTMAIKSDGTLWGLGLNVYGQLGDGTEENSTVFKQVNSYEDWLSVSSGLINTYALKKDGSLWGWGNNEAGQLANSEMIYSSSPLRIGEDNDWIKVNTDGYFVIAQKSDGSLWSWGFNNNGQLGIKSDEQFISTPTIIGEKDFWMNFDLGYEYAIAIKSDSTLWGWGYNANGQVGNPSEMQYNEPILIDNSNKWIFVEAGASYAFAIDKEGNLWAWGFNGNGQLGAGHTNQLDRPQKIGENKDWHIISAAKSVPYNGSLFGSHSLGLKNDKNVICVTGSNYVGQLGDNSQNEHNVFDCVVGVLTNLEEEQMSLKGVISLQPNPATDKIVINVSYSKPSLSKIEIYNLLGIKQIDYLIDNKSGENSIPIDVSDLTSGTYFIFIKSDKEVFKQTFIKE